MFKKLFIISTRALASLAIMATILTTPATATPYEEMVEVDILDGWRGADGTHMAAVQMTLKPGWKTYWRAPGDAGIPPVMVWSGSRNLANAEITWPTPRVFNQAGMTSIGYKNRVILPITITPKNPNRPVRLQLNLQIGICKEICVPAQFTLDHVLPATLAKRDPKITAALADRPFSASEAGVKAVKCTISATPDGLLLHAEITMPPVGGREFVVFEATDSQIWSSEAKTHRTGRTLVAETELMHVNGGGFALDRSGLRITVLGKSRAVDIQGCR